MPDQDKRELLKRLLRENLGQQDARLRLSAGQLRLWELETSSPSPSMHVFAIAYELTGALDADVLEQAISAVAARHFTLHARIVEDPAGPYFEPISGERLQLIRADTSSEGLDQCLRTEAARPLDPKAGPPWRAVLFRVSADRHALLLCFHHIIADRWSVGIFVGDLGTAYSALLEGKAPFGSPPQSPFDTGESDDAAQLEHWRRLFSTPAAALELPFAGGSEDFSDYSGGCIEDDLEVTTLERLKELAAAQGTTLFPVLLAGFGVLLWAHTGQTDLLICTPMIGRNRPATRGVIGYFNNVVPMRLDLGGQPGIAGLIDAVSAQGRAAFEHQNVPLQEIASLPELEGVRTTRCLFTVQNIPGLHLRLPGVATRYRDIPNGTANFDLSLFLEEKEGKLHVLVHHKTARFSGEAIVRLKDRFLECLRFFAEHPAAQVGDLPAHKTGEWRTQTAEGSQSAGDESQPAENMLEQRMIDLWRSLFHRRDHAKIHAASNFFDLGGDSIMAARLFSKLKQEFGVEWPLATLLDAPTPRLLSLRLADKDWAAPWLSLIPLRSAGSRPPLFLLPGGGGNMLSFRHIAQHVGDDQPVYCFRAKGLKRGEQSLSTVEEMAEEFIDIIRHSHPHGPYLLMGHSLGAAVAYEMAQRLLREGEPVPLVGLLDHPGPDIRLDAGDWVRYHLMSIAGLNNRERFLYIWRGLRWKLRMKVIARRMKEPPDSLSKKTDPSTWSSIDVIEASMRALRQYRIEPFAGRVVLFRAEHAPPKIRSDRYGGWGRVALGGVDVFEVPGTHMTMLNPPHVEVLAQAVVRCIDDIVARKPAESSPGASMSARATR